MEVPVVVAASRQEQKITEVSVPMSIITAEDIHYSGATNVAEILRFVPGIDVARFSRDHYGVGVRGLSGGVSNRILVLVNGRQINDSVFDSVDWAGWPVFVEDIDHIEIVRGPASAAWGANALNGVINIVTKEPENMLGGFNSTTVNEYGDIYNHFRYAQKSGQWSWRNSFGYEDWCSSVDSGNGKFIKSTSSAFPGGGGTPGGGTPLGGTSSYINDFGRIFKTDNEFINRISEDTKLTFGGAYSSFVFGSYGYLGNTSRSNALNYTTNLFTKLEHQLENGGSWMLQWSGDYRKNHDTRLFDYGYSVYQDNLETQINFDVGDKHNVSVGGNLRWVRIRDYDDSSTTGLSDNKVVECWQGLFVIDRYELTHRTTIECQYRFDWYSAVQRDWSGRLSLIQALDDDKEHILRFSAARAFRSPSSFLRMYLGTSQSAFSISGNDNLADETIQSFEAGYMAWLNKTLSLNLNIYRQNYKDMIGIDLHAGSSKMENVTDGTADGVEIELERKTRTGKISAWYTYNHFSPRGEKPDIRSEFPALHKTGLTWNVKLPDDWTFYTSFVSASPVRSDYLGLAFGSSECLDFTLTKSFNKGNCEFMIGVSDVLDRCDGGYVSAGRGDNSVATPGKTFFARLQLKF